MIPDLPGTYSVEVTVRDPFGGSSSADLTLTASAEAAHLEVPQAGTITFVGETFNLTASVFDGAGNPYPGATVHCLVSSGPHAGLAIDSGTDGLGNATLSYVGDSEGVDTLQVWTGGDSYAQAPDQLRSEIGHVWFAEGCGVEVGQPLALGWHMVALPGRLCYPCTLMNGECGDLVCALGDNIDPLFAYRYDPTQARYVRIPPADTICYQPGMAVWVYTFTADTTLDASVTQITENVELALQNGWNQVGNPYTFTISTSSILVQCGSDTRSLVDAQAQGWVSATLYGYDTALGLYAEIDPVNGCIASWEGGWLRAYRDDCTLVFEPVACTATATASRPLSAAEARARDLPPPPPEVPQQAIDVQDVLSSLSAHNVPNPIRSEHTTVFRVEGVRADAVEGMRVDIYDLEGRCVFTEAIASRELVWHTVNNAGELLANGVYLYRVWVEILGVWYPMEVQKLVVMR